ncbi:chemotaxis protein CheW [Polaromonas sp. YR568]|uniref:chemotaxis protein CheW n=1 Tax=Polaromonas sp. YR568 TaxID=1855301 RepID=UPI00398C1CA7
MQSTPGESPPVARALQFLVFTLGQEEYGLDFLKVQELRRYDTVTRAANAAGHIQGVANRRGTLVPVVDLRIRFNSGTPVYDQYTVLIILNIAARLVGMVVDSVSDVITLGIGQIGPAPESGPLLDTACLTGVGTLGERVLLLVDIDKLMAVAGMGPGGETMH